MNFFKEYWVGFRPYLLRLTISFSVSGILYLGLYLFVRLTEFLPVPGWAGKFIGALHSVGIIVSFGVFALLSVNDIIQVARKGALVCLA
jgi:hypothetical protein